MPPRQQRTRNNRGQVQLANQRPIADLTWTVLSQSGAFVLIQVFGNIAGLVLQSTPPFFIATHSEFAIDAVLVGDEITVQFPSVPNPGEAVTLQSAQQGVRGNLGNYLAAGRQLLPLPPPVIPPVQETTWTIGGNPGGVVILNVDAGTGPQTLVCASGIHNTTTGETASRVEWQTDVLLVEFPSGTSSGDNIAADDLGLALGLAGLRVLEPISQNIP